MRNDDFVYEIANHLRLFHLGPDNATTNAELSTHYRMPDQGKAGREGIPNSRRLTAILNRARELGFPICADHRGIFFARNQQDAEAMVNDYRNRAAIYSNQALFLEQAAKRLERQAA